MNSVHYVNFPRYLEHIYLKARISSFSNCFVDNGIHIIAIIFSFNIDFLQYLAFVRKEQRQASNPINIIFNKFLYQRTLILFCAGI